MTTKDLVAATAAFNAAKANFYDAGIKLLNAWYAVDDAGSEVVCDSLADGPQAGDLPTPAADDFSRLLTMSFDEWIADFWYSVHVKGDEN